MLYLGDLCGEYLVLWTLRVAAHLSFHDALLALSLVKPFPFV